MQLSSKHHADFALFEVPEDSSRPGLFLFTEKRNVTGD